MATEAHGEAGKAVGMPQLDFSTWPNQIFWLLVTLVVIYLVLSRIALPRIGAVLADRKSTITNDLAAADELKQKAVEADQAIRTPPVLPVLIVLLLLTSLNCLGLFLLLALHLAIALRAMLRYSGAAT